MKLFDRWKGNKRSSVKYYMEFAQETGWRTLRKYLLDVVSFDWSEKPSLEQYELLLEMLELNMSVHRDHTLNVAKIWQNLQNDFLQTVRSILHSRSESRLIDSFASIASRQSLQEVSSRVDSCSCRVPAEPNVSSESCGQLFLPLLF